MRRLTGCLAVILAFTGCATVKTYDDLSAVQISALQESNERLDTFDKRLQELDNQLATRKIRAAAYKRQADELTSLIAEESQFQNAILIKDPKIKVMARHLLDNIQKAIEATPVIAEAIALVALRGLAGATITP
jgi:predicted aminopeptidase